MASTTFQVKVDVEKKRAADEIYKSLGTSTAEAFRMFIQKTIDVGGLPFTLVREETPTQETLKAMIEGEQLGHRKSNANTQKSIRSFIESI